MVADRRLAPSGWSLAIFRDPFSPRGRRIDICAVMVYGVLVETELSPLAKVLTKNLKLLEAVADSCSASFSVHAARAGGH